MKRPRTRLGADAGLRVGNDVVDLAHPRCGDRPAPDPLERRILTGDEREWLHAAAPAERRRRLWSLWAGKETAFKVASKLRGAPPVFRHRAFEVELAEAPEGEGIVRLGGRVRWEGLAVRIEGVATPGFVHLVGWGPWEEEEPVRPVLEVGVEGTAHDFAPAALEASAEERAPPLTSAERRGVGGALSERARGVARSRLAGHLARAGASSRGARRPRVEIVTSADRPGRSPPRIVVDGVPRPDLDVSLSHHGRYVGWALLLPGPDGVQKLGR